MRMTIAAMMAIIALDAGAVQARDQNAQSRHASRRAPRPEIGPSSAIIETPAPVPILDRQIVRTFVVELHEISKDDYERAIRGNDFRLASVGSKPRPHAHFEMRGQGDVFTGWASGMDMPYQSGGIRRHEFVGTIGEVQPSDRPDFRRLMLKDSRLVKFYSFKDAAGNKSRVPIVRKSEMIIDFPLDGYERSEVYAIPRGKKKFDYRLLTVHEDVGKRRVIRYLDAAGMP